MSQAIEQEALRALLRAQAVERGSAFLRFQPRPYQLEWIHCDKPIVLITAGNRVGKTSAGAIRTLIQATGVYPPAVSGIAPPRAFPLGTKRQQKILVCGETMSTSVRQAILPKLREFIVPDMLVPGPRAVKRNPQTGDEQIIRFRSGCEIVIGSYDQQTSAHEGAKWDFVWFDEPPPEPFFNTVRRGTIDAQAQIFITATPLKEAWMMDRLVVASKDQANPLNGRVGWFTVGSHANCLQCSGGYLDHDTLEAYFSTLDPRERAARESGEFLELTGLEFAEFRPEIHVVEDLF